MDANKLKRDLLKNKSHDIFKNVQALWDLVRPPWRYSSLPGLRVG